MFFPQLPFAKTGIKGLLGNQDVRSVLRMNTKRFLVRQILVKFFIVINKILARQNLNDLLSNKTMCLFATLFWQ